MLPEGKITAEDILRQTAAENVDGLGRPSAQGMYRDSQEEARANVEMLAYAILIAFAAALVGAVILAVTIGWIN